ncbi:MAG: DUF86 domain-containing protein [Candidatus Sumerlaeota bacterium]|nr:DUF86 domain-containing protein [Candidatus Sumerlaeota bacterium]
MPRDEAILLDIMNAARMTLQFIEGLTKDQFMADAKTQSSVLYQITIIGEASRRLSTEFRVRYSGIPWPLIMGMRNKLIHEYNDVDLHEVWKTIQDDIPDLISRIKPLLKQT